MSPERKVEPSAPIGVAIGTTTYGPDDVIAVAPSPGVVIPLTSGTPLYTADASRLLWAERLEAEATRIGREYGEPYGQQGAHELLAAARWLRSVSP